MFILLSDYFVHTQVLVEIKAVGVNPLDADIRAGSKDFPVNLPHTPGFDGAGVVVDAPSSTRFKVPNSPLT
jgi:NADPH:quinone reductase-like Zn-dependent oxidoreductase